MKAYNPFSRLEPYQTRFWYWLLRRKDPRNIFVELNNSLEGCDLESVTSSDILSVWTLFPKASADQWTRNCEEVFAKYCHHRHNKALYGAEDLKAFRNLGASLGFDTPTIDRIDVTQALPKLNRVFDEAVEEVGFERVLEHMEELYKRADLNTDLIEPHEQEWRTNLVQLLFAKAIADKRYEPEEEAEFNRACEALKVSPRIKEADQGALEKMRAYYRLESEPLQEQDYGLALQKGERCYWRIRNASLQEIRKQRTVHGYHSAGVSFRIMRGVYYRVGASRPVVSTYEGLMEIDRGDLYFTSKRVWFNGAGKNVSLPYQKIMQVVPYTDGIQLVKETGRDQYFLFKSSDVEADHIVLSRLLNEA